MPDISQITLPDSNTYNLVDETKSGIYTVIGTQNADTSAWTGNLHGVSALYDGLTISYYLPYASTGNVTLELTLDNSTTTGSIPVSLYIGKRLSDQINAGASVIISYYSAGSITIGGSPTTFNTWICCADSNEVRQLALSTNANFPVLLGVASSQTIIGSTGKSATNFSYNPSTGNLNTTTVNGYTPTGVWVGTQADYNLLIPDNNVTYFITDGQTAPTPNAGTIGYDNTGSGLSANTVQAAIDEVVDRIYPVGSIYLSVTDSTAAMVEARFGGTWVAFGQGRTLVGFDSSQTEFDTIEETGGTKTHTHHYGIRLGGYYSSTTFEGNTGVGGLNYSDATNYTLSLSGNKGTISNTVINNAAAGSTKTAGVARYDLEGNASYTSTMQPYITVYMYKRTA